MVLYNHADIAMGETNEIKCLPYLEKHLGLSLTRTHRWCPFDYFGGSRIWVELKSRRISYNDHTEVQLAIGKVNFARDPKRICYIAFYFEPDDALYVIKFNKEQFETFERQTDFRRKDRPFQSSTTMVLVPMRLLTLVPMPKNNSPADV